MKNFLKIFLFLFLIIAGVEVRAQNVTAHASIDTNNVLIGDQIRITLEARADIKTNIVMPVLPDSIGRLEVIGASKIDTLQSEGNYILRQKITVTSFDSGSYTVPPFTLMYEKKGFSTMYPAETNILMLNYKTVKVDTTQDIKDIKPPMEVPFAWRDILLYLVLPLVIAAIIGYAIYFFRKRKKKPAQVLDYDPKIPPHIIALEALKQLESEKLWQVGQVKLYHIRLTEIIRTYIERRFLVPALEMTTEEIVTALNNIGIEQDLISKMRKTFELADLAKFAKFQPFPDENTTSMNSAFEFVNKTIPIEINEEKS